MLVALLAACTPFAGSPGASSSATTGAAPTTRGGDRPPGATLPPTDASCRFAPLVAGLPGDVFISIADHGSSGVAFVLDAVTGGERGRLQIDGAPEAAVDWTGRRLLMSCGSRLVAYNLATLREEWSVPFPDRLITKAPGGLPALAVTDDGKLAFELHYRTLRPGDANAPGASRTWLVARDPADGTPKGEVDLGDCGAGRVFAEKADAAYVLCRDGLHLIDTATWSERRTYPFSAAVGPVGLVGGAFYGVTRQLTILSLDLNTETTTEFGKDGPRGSFQSWGRLAIAPDGERVWVVAKRAGDLAEFAPDTLTVLTLDTSERTDFPIAGLRGVGLIGGRVVYGTEGRLRSTDGAFDLPLLSSSPEYWHIFGAPKSAS
jgi:hypothetical protein